MEPPQGEPKSFQTLQSVFLHEGEIPKEFTAVGAVWDESGLYRTITDFVIFNKVYISLLVTSLSRRSGSSAGKPMQ